MAKAFSECMECICLACWTGQSAIKLTPPRAVASKTDINC